MPSLRERRSQNLENPLTDRKDHRVRVVRPRSLVLLLAASAAFLGVAPNVLASPETTNPGGYMTVRVVVTDKSVTLSPTHVRRGSTAIFLLSNLSTTSRVLAVGDATLTRHRGTGFAVKLAKNGQKRVLLYLTYRGPLPLSITPAAGKSKVEQVFYVT
jgi:hypothetical protein